MYVIENTQNGRVYVGQSQDALARFKAHAVNPPLRMKEDARQFQPFVDFFQLRVVEDNLTRREADLKEKELIRRHDATSDKGYNWCVGKPTACSRWWAVRRSKI